MNGRASGRRELAPPCCPFATRRRLEGDCGRRQRAVTMAASYSYRGSDRQYHATLDNGAAVLLRPATRMDRDLFSQGVGEMSHRSRFLRFHSGFERVPPRILDHLVEIDGQNHIAWGAIDKNNPNRPAIAAAHAIRDPVSRYRAEFACGVLDKYQRQGIASLLTARVLHDCIGLGIGTVHAYILYENKPATRLARKLSGPSIGEFSTGEIFSLETEKSLKAIVENSWPGAITSVGMGA